MHLSGQRKKRFDAQPPLAVLSCLSASLRWPRVFRWTPSSLINCSSRSSGVVGARSHGVSHSSFSTTRADWFSAQVAFCRHCVPLSYCVPRVTVSLLRHEVIRGLLSDAHERNRQHLLRTKVPSQMLLLLGCSRCVSRWYVEVICSAGRGAEQSVVSFFVVCSMSARVSDHSMVFFAMFNLSGVGFQVVALRSCIFSFHKLH